VANTEVAVEGKENGALAVADAVVSATATAEAEVVAKSTASRVLRTGAIARLADSAKRFVSSFRGRTVHGVEVALPNGYVGIVLRGDAHGKTHQTTTSNPKRQPTRRRQLRRQSDVVEEAQYLDDAATMSPEDGRPVRVLKPAARFDSFVLWHPDIAVDEGKDEYLRSLSEWVDIAAEVRPRRLIRVEESNRCLMNRFTKASVFRHRCMSAMDSMCATILL
jgi:ribonuclease H2 subunit C